jgi:DNA-binding transcriptional MerR regulator
MANLLSIGELSARTRVAASALRYWEELGLLRPETRVSGRRRYKAAAVEEAGVILFLQELGFSLKEIRQFIRHRSSGRAWRELAARKMADLEAQIVNATAARRAIDHALSCPQDNMLDCPNFWAAVDGVLEGKALAEAHST